MKKLLLALLMMPLTFCAQWPEYDIGTTIDLGGVAMQNDGDIFVSGSLGTILKSTDCGSTWSEIQTNYIDDIGKFQFVNEMVGFVLADDGAYGKTEDGGETWMFFPTPAPDDLESMYFLDEMTGYMVGKDGGIIRTLNGGNTWTLLSSGTTNRLQGVFFTDALHGVVAGRNATLLHTVDGGDSWASITSGISGDLSNIWFNEPNNGFICAEGGLYKVNLDLSVIEYIGLDPLVEMSDIYFTDSNVGWACGDPGAVYVTNSGGDTWIEVTLDGLPFEMTGVHGDALNSVFAVGAVGKVNGLCVATGFDDEFDLLSAFQTFSREENIEIRFEDIQTYSAMTFELIDLYGRLVDRQEVRPASGDRLSLAKPSASGTYLVRVTSGIHSSAIKLFSN